MLCHKCKCCYFSWLSGFFALASLMHIIRLVAQVDVTVGTFSPPMGLSVAVAVIAGGLSLFFCNLGCRACACGPK